jgi:hypothetical protein
VQLLTISEDTSPQGSQHLVIISPPLCVPDLLQSSKEREAFTRDRSIDRFNRSALQISPSLIFLFRRRGQLKEEPRGVLIWDRDEGGRMLSVHGSDAIGGDAAGSDHHSHRIFSFDALVSWRPRSSPIQRCINPLSNP